jgi:hypothetical protein|tara:strand:- start:222 stop:512 length:291 start_codon:yes stop_codon:yes gene_type:complete
MELKSKNGCPLHNFEPCKQLDCAWFTKIAGKNPQGQKEVEEWGCAVTFMPILMVANTNSNTRTQAAVESFRNKMVSQQEELLQLAKQGDIDTKLIE